MIVARVARAHGIRGALLLEAETDCAEALFRAGRRLGVAVAPEAGRAAKAAPAPVSSRGGGAPGHRGSGSRSAVGSGSANYRSGSHSAGETVARARSADGAGARAAGENALRRDPTDGRPAAGPPRAITLSSARPHGGRWLVAAPEVPDRTAAETLRGARLTVPRAELPDLPDGGYLLHDLIGLSVCEAGEAVGVVRDVYDGPGAPLLALDVAGRERLVPFEAELVVGLDFEARAIHMTLPDGLLDI